MIYNVLKPSQYEIMTQIVQRLEQKACAFINYDKIDSAKDDSMPMFSLYVCKKNRFIFIADSQ